MTHWEFRIKSSPDNFPQQWIRCNHTGGMQEHERIASESPIASQREREWREVEE